MLSHGRLLGVFDIAPEAFDPQYDFDFTDLRHSDEVQHTRGGAVYRRPLRFAIKCAIQSTSTWNATKSIVTTRGQSMGPVVPGAIRRFRRQKPLQISPHVERSRGGGLR